ncbi:MAG: hypothetical protein IKS48_02220 [Eubacterium sp.]|nr:hypothetical protein [Eubacterium sp.]
MDEFAKVEKLREKANVTYEEAREALSKANGDLLDAMVLLEKEGKVKSPEQSVYRTSQEAGAQYADVPAIVKENEQKGSEDSFFKKVGRGVKRGLEYVSDNYILVTHKDETVIKVPLWIGILALFFFWEILMFIIIISLFCDCRYRIEGEDKNDGVNRVMEQASDFTNHVKEEFDKL